MDFKQLVTNYQNTEQFNDELFESFTQKIKEFDWLLSHRKFIEDHKLGYGDRAFYYMWLIILNYISKGEKPVNMLEIGVFKGQIISLWSLIAMQQQFATNIYAISPLTGQVSPKNNLLYRLKYLLSSKFRNQHSSANFYADENYLNIITKLYQDRRLSLDNVSFIKGYSTESDVLSKAKEKKYDLIYVDGDHTYEGVLSDLKNYIPLLSRNGILVMDDASNNIPGTKFWKGHQSVSDAVETIPSLGLQNIFNIGHNRVYQRNANG